MPHLILLAEDDIPSADLIRLVCEREGYLVITAQNGREAIDLLAEHPIDLVLMDVRMPVLDGIEATRRIRSNPKTSDIPVIFVTAMVNPDTVAKMEALNPTGILLKPFDLRILMQSLERVLPPEKPRNRLNDLTGLRLVEKPWGVTG